MKKRYKPNKKYEKIKCNFIFLHREIVHYWLC